MSDEDVGSKRMTPVLLIGVAFSALLSVVLVVLGIDTSNSAIIGLIGTTISLLLDLMLRASKMEQNLIDAGGLSREMVKDPQLFSALSSMAGDYHKVVEGAPYKLFAGRAKDVLSECQDNLHNLVEGYMILPPLSQFSFGLKGLSELRRSVKATSYQVECKLLDLLTYSDLQRRILGGPVTYSRVSMSMRRASGTALRAKSTSRLT